MLRHTVGKRVFLCAAPLALVFAAVAFIASRETLREIRLRRAVKLMEAGLWAQSASALAGMKGVRGVLGQPVRMDLALALYHGGRYDEAARLFSAGGWVGSPVLAVRAAFGTGNCLYHLGDAAGATAAYRRALAHADAELEHPRAAGGGSRGIATEARAIREVRRRAAHNLAVAERALAASHAPATAGGEPDIAVPAEGRSGDGGAPADAAGAAVRARAGGKLSEPDALLRDALGRDTGPVLPRPHRPEGAVQGARTEDW